jgi:hypothetical protein
MKQTLLHTTAEVRNAGVALAVKVGIDSELGSTKIKQMLSSMLAGEGLKIIDTVGTKIEEAKKAVNKIKASSSSALANPEEIPIQPKAPPRKSLTDSPMEEKAIAAASDGFQKGHSRNLSRTKSAKHRAEETINERHSEAKHSPDKEIADIERYHGANSRKSSY